MLDYICFVCEMPIVGADIEARHECHEDGCPNRTDADGNDPCDCDLPCHAECCPDCNAAAGEE